MFPSNSHALQKVQDYPGIKNFDRQVVAYAAYRCSGLEYRIRHLRFAYIQVCADQFSMEPLKIHKPHFHSYRVTAIMTPSDRLQIRSPTRTEIYELMQQAAKGNITFSRKILANSTTKKEDAQQVLINQWKVYNPNSNHKVKP